MEPPREGMRVYMNEDLEANDPQEVEEGVDGHETDSETEQHNAHEREAQQSRTEQPTVHPGANIALVPPPPVYGNFRNSIVSPLPSTPSTSLVAP